MTFYAATAKCLLRVLLPPARLRPLQPRMTESCAALRSAPQITTTDKKLVIKTQRF